MSLIENLTKKVTETARTAAKKSGELVEITKLNINIATEEEKIEKIYIEIGKMMYARYVENGDAGEDLNLYCERIKEHEKTIEELKTRIIEVKNARICANCSAEIDAAARFCPKCGSEQEIIEKEEEVKVNVCPACGANIENGNSFCTACGTKL